MTQSVRRALGFAVVAVILSIVICAPQPAAADDTGAKDTAGLAGCYDVTGRDTSEVSYTGTLCITVLGNLLYELTWTQMEDDEGRVIYNGRGVSVGDDLFAVWSEDGTEYDCYLHLFDIDVGDGSLNGLRVNVNGATSSQTSSRKKSKTGLDWSEAGQLAGSYVLENADEVTGKKLKVTHIPIDDDDAYYFHWSGDPGLEGVGVREDNTIVVVAHPVGQVGGTCGSITYSKSDTNRDLSGTFYTPDSLRGLTPLRRGEERATPKE